MLIDINSKEKISTNVTQYLKHGHFKETFSPNNLIEKEEEEIKKYYGSKRKQKEKIAYSLNNNFNSCSISLNSKEENTVAITTIYGPNEAKMRHKIKPESAFIEVITTFNVEMDKDKQNEYNYILRNFCYSIIKTNEYPRCLITVVINVICFENENFLKKHMINTLMMALVLSGIDLKYFALGTLVSIKTEICKMQVEGDLIEQDLKKKEKEDFCLIIKDTCNLENVLSIHSEFPLQINDLDYFFKQADNQIEKELYDIKVQLLKLRQ